MHLLAISLLTILAGTLLLAKFKKDMPGKFFAYISWFFIVVGFILFIGFIAGGICKMKHHCTSGRPDCHNVMMMKNCNHEIPGGFGCPPGMDKGMCPPGPGCMPGMDRGMCPPRPGCMPADSMMKCCPKHMKCDTVKMVAPKN
jgi:hypothetical protein